MKKLLDKSLQVILLLYCLLLPFSYQQISFRWSILLCIFLFGTILFHIIFRKGEHNVFHIKYFIVLFVLLILGFVEKINLANQFSFHLEMNWRISISSILIAIGTIIYFIKILVEKQMEFLNHPVSRYLVLSLFFIMGVLVVFYPFFYNIYNFGPDSNIQLVNKLLKYGMLILISTHYLSNTKRLLTLNKGMFICLSITLVLVLLKL